MKRTFLIIRIVFLLTCLAGSVLVWYSTEGDWSLPLVVFVGMSLGALMVLTDFLVEGFSLRGLTAITFGLGIGALIATFVTHSPLFKPLAEDPGLAGMVSLARIALYVFSMYLATVIALRGKDEFNLVIPYIRFTPQKQQAMPIAVVDTSALIDGRIAAICASGWVAHTLVIPRFVLKELQQIADSPDAQRKAKGRKGLDILNRLRAQEQLALKISESEVGRAEDVDSKLVFLAESMQAKLLTMDFNLAKLAAFHGVEWLNITTLVTALNQEVSVGTHLKLRLVRSGKEAGQAVGYLQDGSMVVVSNAEAKIGEEVHISVDSVVPSAGGKMLFGCLQEA